MAKYEEKKKEFEVGDLVRLKSGGPDMTVKEWSRVYKAWECQWFDGKRLRDAPFTEDQLVRPSPKDTSSQTSMPASDPKQSDSHDDYLDQFVRNP